MQDFVHLHVHTQYSILDGQASVSKLVDKAIANGMKGVAITDHGSMMAIKEFFNYTNKKNGATQDELKACKKRLAALEKGENIAQHEWEKKNEEERQNEMPQFLSIEEQLSQEKKRFNELQNKLFKPIFGCEMYVAPRTMYDRNREQGDNVRYHLIVLAKNKKGYHNLVKLVSNSWINGFYGRPRTDRHELEKYSEGLIICSACIAGEIPHKILRDNREGAEEAIVWFKKVFGDDFYLELQRHEVHNPNQRANRETLPLQQQVNKALIELGKKYDVKLVCTNDVHFVEEENAEAHDRLICLSTNRELDDPKRMLYSKQEWFKTKEEMNEVFADLPEALANTIEICNKIEFYSIDNQPIMPNFDIPEEFGTEEEYRTRFSDQDIFDEFTRDENNNVVLSEHDAREKISKLGGVDKLYRIKLEGDYLAKLTYERAKDIYGDPLSDEVAERLKFELHIMKTMGFPGYFLIVQDYISAARNELLVSVGPGRGSAAGSAVSYCLGITQIDPIKYNLLFERFLNPDRISLPDVDIDFDDDGRGKVLNWVKQKYGHEKVAHIVTYGTMATKLAIKDVARVQKVPLDVSNRLCKLIPDKLPPEGKDGTVPQMNLNNAIAAIPELQAAELSTDQALRDTIRYARMLEGNVRNTGVHACGAIICRDDISDWVPISTSDDKETGEKLRCTQYEGSVIEETGLIKMDFLGLKTLSIIKEAVENIRLSLGLEIDIDKVDIEDLATYKLYCDGRTIGTFQFESAGMQKYLRDLQPSVFEDLIAMNALYRPGPMDYIPDFIDRKHGRKPVEYDIDCMEKYLKDTYGITVYQEQVMLLARQLANFTRGESDTLRKAIGKKMIGKLNQMYPKFVSGGQSNGHDPKVLEKIWADWAKFASYAFNKSHATCYSWIAYQTAYLKANYPAQYMAGVMSRNLANITEITKLMDECKSMGIQTLGPDVNESHLKFAVNAKGDIRFGMAAVKGVGGAAVDAILSERKLNGEYQSVFDFIQRVNLSSCNRRCVESLILSGGFDSFDVPREAYFEKNTKGEIFLDTLIRYGQRYQVDKYAAQNSLFGGLDSVEVTTPEIPQAEPWSDLERLNKERELIGIYLSAHPLDQYAVVLDHVCNTSMSQLEDRAAMLNKELMIGGIVTHVRKGISKTGKPFGIVKIEDFSGAGEIALFGEDWPKWSSIMEIGYTLFITAKFTPRTYNPQAIDLRIANIEFLADVKEKKIEKMTITLQLDQLDDTMVEDLSMLISSKPGKTSLFFDVIDEDGRRHVLLQSRHSKLTVTKELLLYLDTHPSISYKIN